MGLFLQKTNIIRDYYEDIRESPPRVFWPSEIWSKYTNNLHSFKSLEESDIWSGVCCLNAMVCDALRHVPAVIDYLASLRDPSVFRFCAIPQVMAIATLSEVYNNPSVFQVKVKISKADACRIMIHVVDLTSALNMFAEYCHVMECKLSSVRSLVKIGNDGGNVDGQKCKQEKTDMGVNTDNNID